MNHIPLKNMNAAQLKSRMDELCDQSEALESQIYAAREASDAHSEIKATAIREMNALNATLRKITQTVRMGGEPEQPFSEVFDQHQALFARYEQLAQVQEQHYLKLRELYDQTASVGRKVENVRQFLRVHERQLENQRDHDAA
ncbi:hypothetical protein [Devosia sp. A449]